MATTSFFSGLATSFIRGFFGTFRGSLGLTDNLTPVFDSSFNCPHRFLEAYRLSLFCSQVPLTGMTSRSILQMLNLGNPWVLQSRMIENSSSACYDESMTYCSK